MGSRDAITIKYTAHKNTYRYSRSIYSQIKHHALHSIQILFNINLIISASWVFEKNNECFILVQ